MEKMANYDGIRGYALSAIQQNQQIRDNPQFQDFIRAIEKNDSQAGIALANQILKQNGVSKGAAIQQAIQMFGLDNLGGR